MVPIPKKLRHKLQPVSEKRILVGYTGSNYRFFDPSSSKISTVPTAIFYENETVETEKERSNDGKRIDYSNPANR